MNDSEQHLPQYLSALHDQGVRTGRHASESQPHNSPEPQDVTTAQRTIRRHLSEVFTPDASGPEADATDKSLSQVKQSYWERASRVGSEHGAQAGFELDDYFSIGTARSYPEIRGIIRESYAEQSLPNKLIDSIDCYSDELDINPSYAARIAMEFMSRRLHDIQVRAEMIRLGEGVDAKTASTAALKYFMEHDVPQHAQDIAQLYGTGETTIIPACNKQSFYPGNEFAADEPGIDALVVSPEDARGLIEAYDIQSRPYDAQTLQQASELVARPEIQMMLLQFHEGFVAMAEKYFEVHPERLQASPEIYSEVFVPEMTDDGVRLLPNPKLLRALVNNIMPAVALHQCARGEQGFHVTQEDIESGVHLASRTLKLFQTKIAQLNNYDSRAQTVELRSVYSSVCPAGSMLPQALERDLPRLYRPDAAA